MMSRYHLIHKIQPTIAEMLRTAYLFRELCNQSDLKKEHLIVMQKFRSICILEEILGDEATRWDYSSNFSHALT